MKAHRFFLAIVITSAFTIVAPAQRQRPPAQLPRENNFFLTTFTGISRETGKSRVMIFYRLPRNFLVFTRDAQSADPDAALAGCEVSIELRDSTGGPSFQKLIKRTFRSSGDPATQTDSLSFSGSISCTLPPGRYSGKYEVIDDESKRTHRDDSLALTVRPFPKDSLGVSDLLFVAPSPDSTVRTFFPLNYGATIPFGQRAEAYVQLTTGSPVSRLHVVYEMFRYATEGSPRQSVFRDSVSPGNIQPAGECLTDEQTGSFTSGEPFGPGFGCRFALPIDTLRQGNYVLELRIFDGVTERMIEQHLTIKWIGMPFSLRSLTSAVAAMKYILTEDEFDKLESAGDERQREMFEEYWKKHDATPSTAFNEVMAEFYRRVDHAVTSFATLKEQNGMRSDRGKVYILYGAPTRVERRLIPSSSPQEIWYYERLKKKVIFLDPSRAGDYKLLSMDNL